LGLPQHERSGLKSWRDLGIDMDEVPADDARQHGRPGAGETEFRGMAKETAAARQDTVLGATAADLWRRGKINFRDLLDQSGRPLTTEQLRESRAVVTLPGDPVCNRSES
jgi:hypothetical protein